MIDAVGNRTISDLLRERVDAHPGKTFVIFEDRAGEVRRYSYQETWDLSLRTAAGLASLGVRRGDRVLLHLRNSPEFLFVWFGLASMGAVMVPSNIANTTKEIAFIAERAEIAAAIVGDEFVAVVSPGVGSVPVVSVGSAVESTITFTDLLQHPPLAPDSSVSSEDVSQILFTSGTTSKPKGVLVTHANALWSGERALKGMGYAPEDRCMTALPLFHVNAQAVTTLGALTAGATIVLLEQFSATRYLQQLLAHEVTQTSLVATQSRALLAQPPGEHDRAHRLTRVGHAINVTDAEHEDFERRFGVRFINIYGLSEATEIVAFTPLYGDQRWPAQGLPAIDREVRIAAEDGSESAVGEPGEIQLRGVPGRTVMAGYFGDPDATTAAYQDGWLRTGDYGYMDADGYIYFVDRQKDLIKASGQNISASEVEEVLNLHPLVVESAVIAIPHPTRGEAVKAFVVRSDDELTPELIVEHCAEHLSKYKLPEVIEFLEALPRTSVGKIAKGELRALPSQVIRS